MTLPAVLALYAVLTVIDAGTTLYMLSRGAMEINPFLSLLYGQSLMLGTIVKLSLATIPIAALAHAWRHYQVRHRWAENIILGVTGFVVALNSIQIIWVSLI